MTNSKTSRTMRVVLAATAALAVAGCSGGSGAPASPTPSATASPSISTTPTPPASPSPTPSSVSEVAAVDAVVRFQEVLDRLSADPESDLTELNLVASGQSLLQWQSILMQYRAEGWRQVGEQTSTLVGSTAGSSSSQWFVDMCVDVSGADVLDSAGNSVRQGEGPTRVLTEFTVEQRGVSEPWFVTQDEAKNTC